MSVVGCGEVPPTQPPGPPPAFPPHRRTTAPPRTTASRAAASSCARATLAETYPGKLATATGGGLCRRGVGEIERNYLGSAAFKDGSQRNWLRISSALT